MSSYALQPFKAVAGLVRRKRLAIHRFAINLLAFFAQVFLFWVGALLCILAGAAFGVWGIAGMVAVIVALTWSY